MWGQNKVGDVVWKWARRSTVLALALASTSCAVGEAEEDETVGSIRSALEITEWKNGYPCVSKLSTVEKQLYIAPDGSDDNDGSCGLPLKTLNEANDKAKASPGTYAIFVNDGTYNLADQVWDATWPVFTVTIQPVPGATPVFEGQGNDDFLTIKGYEGPTRVTLRGMTIRNYVGSPVTLKGHGGCPDKYNSQNVIEDNVFEKIGDLYGSDSQTGYAAINGFNSRNNIIRNNVFSRIENRVDTSGYIHAIYLAHNSTDNIIEDNFFEDVSGTPIKFRDNASRNVVRRNYFNRTGEFSFILQDDQKYGGSGCVDGTPSPAGQFSVDTDADGNIGTFPYSRFNELSIGFCHDLNTGRAGVCPEDSTKEKWQYALVYERPSKELVTGLAIGDLTGDGAPDVTVSMRYNGTLSKIVSTKEPGDRFLRRVLYVSELGGVRANEYVGRVTGITIGKFNSAGKDQLIVAGYDPSSTRASLSRGSGAQSITETNYSTARDLNPRFYDNDEREITALTAGNFDGEGNDELLTALLTSDGQTKLMSGNGKSGIGSAFYTSTYWTISAMAAADMNGDGRDRAFVAFETRPEDNTPDYRIYEGNGTSSVTSKRHYASTTKRVTALEAADVGSLFTAVTDGNTQELYEGIPAENQVLTELLYSTSSWDIPAVVFDDGAGYPPIAGGPLMHARDQDKRTYVYGGTSLNTTKTRFYRADYRE